MNIRIPDVTPVLERVRAAGIDLWVSNGQLHFRAPAGALTAEVRDVLRERKGDLIDCLASPRFRPRGTGGRQRALQYYDGLWEKIRSGALGVNFTNGTHWAAAVAGPLDTDALRDSVRQLVKRHGILAARLCDHEKPQFDFDQQVPFEFVDLRGLDAERRAAARDAALDKLMWGGFAPGATFLRVFAITLARDEHVIGFVVNHYVADLASVHIIAGELIAGYEGQAGAEPALQYADYVASVTEWLDSPARDYRLRYWQRRLAGMQPSRLPTMAALDEAAVGAERFEGFRIEPGVLHGLQAMLPGMGVTLFDALLAAKACALHFALGQRDIAVLAMHHGRDDPILQGLVGSTQNQLVLRLEVDGGMTLAELARAAHATTAEAYRHQLPWHYVRNGLPAVGASTLLAEINFVDNTSGTRAPPSGGFMGSLRPQGIRWPQARNVASRMPAHFLKVEASAAGITGGMGYLDTVYTQTQIREFLDAFRASVLAFAGNPARRLEDCRR